MSNRRFLHNHKPKRNKLNYLVIEVKRDSRFDLPFVVIIGQRVFRFTLPGWLPWLMWLPLVMLMVGWLFVRQQAAQGLELGLLRILFTLLVWYFAICQADCLRNAQAIAQAAHLTVHGLPRAPGVA